MSQFPPPDPNFPDPNSAEQADQESVRAILRAAPTLAVPRDFTLDPALYGRSRLRSGRVVGFPGVWRGLTAAAAILVVAFLATLLASQNNQPSLKSLANNSNAIALQPTIGATALSLIPAVIPTATPMITIIAPNTSIAAKTAQNQDNISDQTAQSNQASPYTAQVGEGSSHTPQNQAAPQSAGAVAPQPQLRLAPSNTPIQPTPIPSATQLVPPLLQSNAIDSSRDLRSEFVAIVRALLYWLRLIPAP